MQSQILIDLRMLNARLRGRGRSAAASDYMSKLISADPQQPPDDSEPTWDEWLPVPWVRTGRRFDA